MLSIVQAKQLSSLVTKHSPSFWFSHWEREREPSNESMHAHFQDSLLHRMLPRSVTILGVYLAVLGLFTTGCSAQDMNTIEGE